MKLFSKDLPPENASAEAKAAYIARYKAATKAADEAQPAQTPAPTPKPTSAILSRSKQLIETVKFNAYSKYTALKEINPREAGEYWRANKDAIIAAGKS